MSEQVMSLKHLDVYREEDEIRAQSDCVLNLEHVLDGLLGLVALADIPPETRQYFVLGIAHLRGHVHCELMALITERLTRCQ